MPEWRGQLHGWNVRSELPLGGCAGGADIGTVDLTVRVGEARELLEGPPPGELLASWSTPEGEPFFDVASTGAGFLLRFRRRCEFATSAALDEVTCHPASGAPLESVTPYLVGTALATLLNLAGHVVLHASTFAVDAGGGAPSAVAVLGESGAGKSTLAALACAAGAGFVGDDVLRVDGLDDRPRAVAGHGETRLRTPVAAGVLALFREPPATRMTSDGRVALCLGAQQLDDVPLGAFVVPVRLPGLDRRPRVGPLEPVDALLALARSPRVSGWRDRGCLASHFNGARQLAELVPVLRLELPATPLPCLGVVEEALALVAASCRAGRA